MNHEEENILGTLISITFLEFLCVGNFVESFVIREGILRDIFRKKFYFHRLMVLN